MNSPTPLSVSQLNSQVRRLLETRYGNVEVEGEISNFSAPQSGHWYFTLKDDKAQMSCGAEKLEISAPQDIWAKTCASRSPKTAIWCGWAGTSASTSSAGATSS